MARNRTSDEGTAGGEDPFSSATCKTEDEEGGLQTWAAVETEVRLGERTRNRDATERGLVLSSHKGARQRARGPPTKTWSQQSHPKSLVTQSHPKSPKSSKATQITQSYPKPIAAIL